MKSYPAVPPLFRLPRLCFPVLCLPLLCLSLLCLPLAASADPQSEEVLARLRAALSATQGYKADFRVMGQDIDTASGSYTVSGDRFYLQIADSEVYCDGKTRWEVANADQAILICPFNPNDNNAVTNPPRAFDTRDWLTIYGGEVNVGGTEGKGGRECVAVILRPRKTVNTLPYTIWIDKQTFLPVVIKYTVGGQGLFVTVIFDVVTPLEQVDATIFSIDPSKYNGYTPVDIRNMR